MSDDQLALRQAARDLLDKQAAPERVRVVAAADPAGRIDRDLWRAMVEQGWLAIELPEDDGGLGLGMVETAVLLEELGRHVAPVPYLPTILALGALHDAGETDLAQQLAAGERIGAVAWRDEPVVGGPLADVVVVADEQGVAVVEQPGIGAEPAMDVTRPLGWLRDRAPARQVGGPDAAARLLDRAAAGVSAELLGAAARVLELSAGYAKDRVQFGRPIGSFQAVKHRCADMLVDVEAMRSAVYWAAWCIAAGHDDAPVAASTAKTWCADAAKRVMASGLQVHGGIGFTWEHDLHLFLKRSQLDQVSYGDATFHRDRLAGLLRARVQAGESVV